MTLKKLEALPLSPAFAYKVKKGDTHQCFFRYSTAEIAWLEVVTGQTYRDESAVKAIIAYEMKFGEFVLFQCCCFDCFTPEAKRIGREYMQRNGVEISNGYFPECAVKMNKYYNDKLTNPAAE